MRKLDDLKQCKRCFLYGIGNNYKTCRDYLGDFFPLDVEIIAVDSDSKKWDTISSKGDTIISPNDMKKMVDSESCVVISTIKNQYEIAVFLRDSIGIDENRIFMYTDDWYEDKIYLCDEIGKNTDKVKQIAEKLEDDSSREYYLNQFWARTERSPFFLIPNKNAVVCGEYKDIKISAGDYIVDCGAYDGDTLDMYMKRTNNDCHVYAFEPFEMNYKKLVKRIEDNKWNNNVTAFNMAVGYSNEMIQTTFNDDDFGMALNISNYSGTRKTEIEVVRLDDILSRVCKIDYIKMDIEGEEKNALNGAREIISKYHPKLLISGYHKIEDFWEIPTTIWDIYNGYKIFVSHAPGVSTELEFYCI